MTPGPLTTVLSEDGRHVLCGNRRCSLTLGYAGRREGEAPVLVAGYRQTALGVWERRQVERGDRASAKPRLHDKVRCWSCRQLMTWIAEACRQP